MAISQLAVASVALLGSGLGGVPGPTAIAQELAPTQVNPAQSLLPLSQMAGASQPPATVNTPNPYSGNQAAIQQGHELFLKMNCAGCHGYNAKGGMGPDLTDKFWRHGGAPASVYDSIAEGRSHGMPAWGEALPPASVWALVAYIESLGGTYPPDGFSASFQGDRDKEIVPPGTQTLDQIRPQLPGMSRNQANGDGG